MIFGRVEGFVRLDGDSLELHVTLETGANLVTVREERVPRLSAEASFQWQADQYTQETIGTVLALEGWEVIGGGELPFDEDSTMFRSARYAVRRA
jgi:hypothetical protein